MTDRYERRILDHVRHSTYTPRRIAELADDLGVPGEDRELFAGIVKSLVDAGKLEMGQGGGGGLVSLLSLATLAARGDGTVTGTFRKNLRGFGFVNTKEPVKEGNVFIPADATGDALSGDVVRITFARDRRSPGGDGYAGTIVEVVQRKKSSYTGTIQKRGGQWVAVPDGKQITQPIIVRDAESKNAKEGDKVVLELTLWPEGDYLGEGVIVRVLGEAGRPDVETQAVIAAYNLPGEFPESCVDQAREAATMFEEEIARYVSQGAKALDGRDDLTEEFIITIDPPDAKDYDDAIHIKRLTNTDGGGWEVGVHIADVAHYIGRGTALDVEAMDRANSCYLPRHVIPMLPEVLSNGICSLQEGVHRYCKTAYMIYDSHGNIRGERVSQTLIKSAKRLSYLEAQALIDGDIDEARKHAKTPPKYTDQLIDTLQEMNKCAKAIQGRRNRAGMIVLDLPDVVLIYDEHGHVVDAEREDDAFTHKLIEMFMVEANEVLARLFEGLKVPLLRRIHPDPVPGDVDKMRQTAMVAGFKIPKNPTREELQNLLNATRGTPQARAVHLAVLRTLSKAEYSPALIGHFALASEAYAHFTSPIRRYADLTVHRALAEYLRRTENGAKRPRNDAEKHRLGEDLLRTNACPSEDELTDIGRNATMREVNAEQAEKELRSFLVLQLLEKRVGEVFKGVVTGISPRGIHVQLDKFLSDGFVKSEDLPGDVTRENLTPIWRVDAKSGALVDIRSGRSFNFGDLISVKIANVDLAKRQLDLVVDDAERRAGGKMKAIAPKPGGLGGGFVGKGAGFGDGGGKSSRTGAQKRSLRSKGRDERKKEHRRDS